MDLMSLFYCSVRIIEVYILEQKKYIFALVTSLIFLIILGCTTYLIGLLSGGENISNFFKPLDEFVIKGAMHHSSLESQKTYTEPHIKKIAEQLSQAINFLSDNNKARTGIEILQGN